MIWIWSILRREPLAHFVALAALLFVANALWPGDDREVIRVDRSTQDFLIRQQADLLLRPLTPEEEEEVVGSYIEDELLWREAYARGLDRNPIIRRQLVQNMRLLLSGDLPKPTEEQLRAFYEQEKARFEMPPALTLDHVFFADSERVPEATLARLREAVDHRSIGDFDIDLGRRISHAGQRQLVELFGPESARAILSIEDGEWHGPILSRRGAHYVRIAKRHPPRRPTYEVAAPYLEGEWLLAKQRETLDRELEAVRQRYDVVVEPSRAGSDG